MITYNNKVLIFNTKLVNSVDIGLTGGTGTSVSYTADTYLDAFTQQAGVTSTVGFDSNNGCWQLYYSHTTVTILNGSNRIGLNTYASGSNSWRWYITVSNRSNTIGDWGTTTLISPLKSFTYVAGGFNESDISTNITIPAYRYFLIMNEAGPFFRTIRPLSNNRTAQINNVNYVTICNKVCLGNWPVGGSTQIPVQFGGSSTGYTYYDAHTHVHSVKFG